MPATRHTLAEVIVYDNSVCTYKTRDLVREFPNILYLCGPKRQPGGRNQILRHVRTQVICFIDDDCVIPSPRRYFARVVEDFALGKDAKTAAVGGPVIPSSRLGLSQATHSGVGFNRVLGTRKTVHEQNHSACWIPEGICDVDFVQGGNMSFATVTLIKEGGFDETYGRGGSWGEETDPQLRLRESGYRILYDPELLVNHLDLPSGGSNPRSRLDQIYKKIAMGRNDVYLMRKHRFLNFNYLSRDWRFRLLSLLDLRSGRVNQNQEDGTLVRLGSGVLSFFFWLGVAAVAFGNVLELLFPSSPKYLTNAGSIHEGKC